MLRHNPEPGVYEYIIQTFEDYLGVLMLGEEFGDSSELLIWDWKTGELYLVSTTLLRPCRRAPTLCANTSSSTTSTSTIPNYIPEIFYLLTLSSSLTQADPRTTYPTSP